MTEAEIEKAIKVLDKALDDSGAQGIFITIPDNTGEGAKPEEYKVEIEPEEVKKDETSEEPEELEENEPMKQENQANSQQVADQEEGSYYKLQ